MQPQGGGGSIHARAGGWVRAGARADLRLPATLVGFPEGLRLHAYGLAPEGRTTYAVDPGAQVVRLVIPRAPMGG